MRITITTVWVKFFFFFLSFFSRQLFIARSCYKVRLVGFIYTIYIWRPNSFYVYAIFTYFPVGIH